MNSEQRKKYFSKSLRSWHLKNQRPLPWKDTNDPYKIWLSEIILQQTRIEQGTPYYLRLIKLFPTVFDLANCKEDELMKAWQGLGYYSRARNLHHTAKHIAKELNGSFPSTYNDILKLKGIGPYTAAAIASFAFNEPTAVVDGNVFRVLARFFGIETPIDSGEAKKKFTALANELIDKKNPGGFNQAIMDFGATLCKPASPECFRCPMKTECVAFKKNTVEELPVKAKKLKVKERFFHFLIIRSSKGYYLEKRDGKDIWKGLYQFPVIENKKFLSLKQLQTSSEWKKIFGKNKIVLKKISEENQQLLSHQRIRAKFFEVHQKALNGNFKVSSRQNLSLFAFPKIIDNYIKNVLH